MSRLGSNQLIKLAGAMLNDSHPVAPASLPISGSRSLKFKLWQRLLWLGWLGMMAPTLASESGYVITTVGGFAYGPGPMPATPITYGRFVNIVLNQGLEGVSSFFNNGPEAEPNHTGALKIFGAPRSVLSNGVPFNEHMDGGVITIGQGALHMMAGIPADGPSQGKETYQVDARLNWHWYTDIALDPGFPQGLVVSKKINITSGIIWVLPSIQTETGGPGGFDKAGEIPSGGPVVGRLGDQDDDGFLDATMVGVGRVPLGFIFVPGAPLVMTRSVVTTIPVQPHVSAILELASIHNLAEILKPTANKLQPGSAVERYYLQMLPLWAADFAKRANHAALRLAHLAAPETALAQMLAHELTTALAEQHNLAGYRSRIQVALSQLEQILPQLQVTFMSETRTSQ